MRAAFFVRGKAERCTVMQAAVGGARTSRKRWAVAETKRYCAESAGKREDEEVGKGI